MEMLIVLAIVGISAGAVVLGLASTNRDTGVQTEANRFADRLRLAADDVLTTGSPLSVTWTPTAYRFESQTNLTEALATPHRLSGGVRLTGPQDAGSALIDPDGAAPPLNFTFRRGDQAWRVLFDGLNAVSQPVQSGEA